MSRMGQCFQLLDEQERAEITADSAARRAARPETPEDRRRNAIKDRLAQRADDWRTKKYGSALTR